MDTAQRHKDNNPADTGEDHPMDEDGTGTNQGPGAENSPTPDPPIKPEPGDEPAPSEQPGDSLSSGPGTGNNQSSAGGSSLKDRISQRITASLSSGPGTGNDQSSADGSSLNDRISQRITASLSSGPGTGNNQSSGGGSSLDEQIDEAISRLPKHSRIGQPVDSNKNQDQFRFQTPESDGISKLQRTLPGRGERPQNMTTVAWIKYCGDILYVNRFRLDDNDIYRISHIASNDYDPNKSNPLGEEFKSIRADMIQLKNIRDVLGVATLGDEDGHYDYLDGLDPTKPEFVRVTPLWIHVELTDRSKIFVNRAWWRLKFRKTIVPNAQERNKKYYRPDTKGIIKEYKSGLADNELLKWTREREIAYSKTKHPDVEFEDGRELSPIMRGVFASPSPPPTSQSQQSRQQSAAPAGWPNPSQPPPGQQQQQSRQQSAAPAGWPNPSQPPPGQQQQQHYAHIAAPAGWPNPSQPPPGQQQQQYYTQSAAPTGWPNSSQQLVQQIDLATFAQQFKQLADSFSGMLGHSSRPLQQYY